MSDKPEPTAEEKMADALPANAKYVEHTRIAEGLIDHNDAYQQILISEYLCT